MIVCGLRGSLKFATLVGAIILLLPFYLMAAPCFRAGHRGIAVLFFRICLLLSGITLRVEGVARRGEKTIYVGNHVSYLDIPALGASINGAFIAKKDVSDWPIFGLLASVSGTLFVSRQRQNVKTERKAMADRIAKGQSLILFPEGTSSDGTEVCHFHAGLLAAAWLSSPQDTFVQPFSIIYGPPHPKCAPAPWQDRDHYAWYGNMELWPHLWQLFATGKKAAVTIVFHPPRRAAAFTNPREVARWSYDTVAKSIASKINGVTDQGGTWSPPSQVLPPYVTATRSMIDGSKTSR